LIAGGQLSLELIGVEMTDLWPQDFGVITKNSPLAILKEQASLLGGKTSNIVKATVKKESEELAGLLRRAKNDAMGVRSDAFGSRSFSYAFFLQAPALDNYTYRLFRIIFDVDIYPVRFFVDDAIAEELSINSKDGVPAADEEEFKQMLSRILGSQKTRKVINAILSQTDVALGNGSRSE
jgi:hypothetical protein